ncbi:MAG TPA: aldo/keto reductase, partial [Lacipirellula sp.]
PKLASVHDPDEYLAAASGGASRAERWRDVVDAYRALHELKSRGEVKAIGVGAKDWKVIAAVVDAVQVDWVMLAGSLTIQRHAAEVIEFVRGLGACGIGIINSAVFQAGFLVGGRYLDYRVPDPSADAAAFEWREAFFKLCNRHEVSPAVACVEFALSPPGVAAVALNSNSAQQVVENGAAIDAAIPAGFWQEAKQQELISRTYPWV